MDTRHEYVVYGLVFAPDNRRLFSAGLGGKIFIHDVQTWVSLLQQNVHLIIPGYCFIQEETVDVSGKWIDGTSIVHLPQTRQRWKRFCRGVHWSCLAHLWHPSQNTVGWVQSVCCDKSHISYLKQLYRDGDDTSFSISLFPSVFKAKDQFCLLKSVMFSPVDSSLIAVAGRDGAQILDTRNDSSRFSELIPFGAQHELILLLWLFYSFVLLIYIDASMLLGPIRTPRAPDSTAKEVVCCAVLKQKDPLSTMFQRSSRDHRQMEQKTRFSWKPLVILFLLALGVQIAALPMTMTNWSSLRPLIIVSSSGPFPKDVEIAPSFSPFLFPFPLDIHILLIMLLFARPLTLWPLSALKQSNCGHQQQFAAKAQIIRSVWKIENLSLCILLPLIDVQYPAKKSIFWKN